MALARSLTAIRSGVLAHLRVPVSQSVAQHQAPPSSWQFVRAFAGTYLDKNDVTERVLNVVKNFDQKVDQSKVPQVILLCSAACTAVERLCCLYALLCMPQL